MKAIAADASCREFARQRKFARQRRLASVKSRIEAGDLRHIRCHSGNGPDRGDVMRLVQRRKRDQLLKTGHHLRIDHDRVGIRRSAMHDAVADAGKFRLAANVTGEPMMNRRDSGAVVVAADGCVRDDAALRIRNLQPGRCPDARDLATQAGRERPVASSFKHRELDAGGASVNDENRLAHHVGSTP